MVPQEETNPATTHNKDFSECKSSNAYLDMVAHQIPISDLYRLINTKCTSEQNNFCAVLLLI
jgi:hypothetical protein